jgi:hypothetical protein
MRKIFIAIFIISVSFIQPVFAETTQLKQWIAPPECVIDGNILTPDECDQLLHPTPPATEPPVTSTATDTRTQKPTSPYWQISSFLFPFAVTSPSPVDESGIRIVDRSEKHTPNIEYIVINLIVLLLILIGTVLLIFTSRRKIANLPK